MESISGKRILITGASGFIGSHLADRLVREGAFVGALSRTEGRLRALENRPAIQFIRCDLTSIERTRQAVKQFSPNILYHLAGHTDGPEDFDRCQTNINSNIQCTVSLLEAFRVAGGRTFIYGDSTKVYGDSPAPYRSDTPLRPLSSYAIAKAAGWQFCQLYQRLYGSNVISVRPTMIYGPRQNHNLITNVAEGVLEGRAELALMGGLQTRDPLYIDDALDAFVAIAQNSETLRGSVLNMSGGDERTVAEIASTVVELMGSVTRVVPRADQARPTDTMRSCCDNDEAKRLLNWQPKTTLRDGLQNTINYLVVALQTERAVDNSDSHRPAALRKTSIG